MNYIQDFIVDSLIGKQDPLVSYPSEIDRKRAEELVSLAHIEAEKEKVKNSPVFGYKRYIDEMLHMPELITPGF